MSLRCFWPLVVLGAAPAPGAAAEGEFAFIVGDVEAEAGGSFDLPFLADAPSPYQGFSFTVAYPPAELEVERIGVQGTLLEAMRPDFIHGEAYPAESILTVGVLLDALPPFEGELVPSTGFPLAVARATGRVLRPSPGAVPVEFSQRTAPPAVANLFSVENLAVAPSRLVAGRVRVVPPLRHPAFIRGDANLDRAIDLSDVIMILAWRFYGDPGPRCDDAADANADDGLDVSDAVFILQFLFIDGPRPFPPQGRPGTDPFLQGELGCAEPLEWHESRT